MRQKSLRLGVNIDHVATLRNARGGAHPDPVEAALLAEQAGADGITAHLREDRRHIRDEDIRRLKASITLPLNLEMAATGEMLAVALATKPHACCLVPERRAELTTEGGLDVAGQAKALQPVISKLRNAGIRVSLFINADAAQVEAAKRVGADIVEFHTGKYCEYFHSPLVGESQSASVAPRDAVGGQHPHDSASAPKGALLRLLPHQGGAKAELSKIQQAVKTAHSLGLECHAGHGLTYENVGPIAAIPEIVELNIGHFLIGQAVFEGLEAAVRKMRALMDESRRKP